MTTDRWSRADFYYDVAFGSVRDRVTGAIIPPGGDELAGCPIISSFAYYTKDGESPMLVSVYMIRPGEVRWRPGPPI